MKKLAAALSLAVGISATIVGISKPASADQISWRFFGYDASYTTPYFYDENYVRYYENRNIVVARVSGGGNVGFLGLSCSQRVYGASRSGNIKLTNPIPPGSAADQLHRMFCH